MAAATTASPTVLAGDIGGTHARLALARDHEGAVALVAQRTLAVRDFPDPSAAIAEFLRGEGAVPATHGCLAWAGPIEGERARLTNASWHIDAHAVAARFGMARLMLVNDFHAAAAGIDHVAAKDLVTLQAGHADPSGARLVIGAGTGLGVAYVIRGPHGPCIVSGEGGHLAFGPQDAEQDALLAHARASLGRVTAEHLVSGNGIERLYRFCCERAGLPVPANVASEGAAAIAQRAQAGEATAVDALRLFCVIFGAVAGDHALSCLATGGVFVAGGIAIKLASRMQDGAFRAAFAAKGVHAALAARMPVHVVLDDALGLKGAAGIALARARGL